MTVASSVRMFCAQVPAILNEPRSDSELMHAFIQDRDESAFACLLRRHASMVWGVAHRILRDTHLADDVTQATFLILARRSASAAKLNSLGGWLHEVARRCALKLRERQSRQPECVAEVPESATSENPIAPVLLTELRESLDEEIGRLGSEHREAMVLHYLEGLSYAQLTQRLGWPRGTVASRLAHARDRLRERLSARGIDLSSFEAWSVLALAGSPLICSPVWAGQTAQGVRSVLNGNSSGFSQEAVRLSHEVMNMSVSAWKLSLAGVALFAVMGFAVGQPGDDALVPNFDEATPVPPMVDRGKKLSDPLVEPRLDSGPVEEPSDPRQQYLELVRERLASMSAAEVEALLAKEQAESRERQANRELKKILLALEALVKKYPGTQASAAGGALLSAYQSGVRGIYPASELVVPLGSQPARYVPVPADRSTPSRLTEPRLPEDSSDPLPRLRSTESQPTPAPDVAEDGYNR